ncbi:hypothetical protein CEXT_157001 [Caerostris extrusa]|uniref:Uncharacterized protein n=1 Tax=Caerostris extrusa TaxID=172846 RepID=A0AAV4P1C6_CAEEX|nr:hypothetical protein CEXT_157001 [Caerostris extrusa]
MRCGLIDRTSPPLLIGWRNGQSKGSVIDVEEQDGDALCYQQSFYRPDSQLANSLAIGITDRLPENLLTYY